LSAIAAGILGVLPGLEAAPATAQIVVSSTVPHTLPSPLTPESAAEFAWNEFIALNWPEQAGMRGQPDDDQYFGNNALGPGQPLVWETLRSKVELFPGNGDALHPPNGWTNSAPGYGFNTPPNYLYASSIPACPGQPTVATPAWINLDEVSEIGLNSLYTGILPPTATANNSKPNLVRFLAKANETEYTYVDGRNDYWYQSDNLTAAEKNFKDAVKNNVPPVGTVVSFPAGSIEIKAAWRQMGLLDQRARFHTATARYYEKNDSKPCYRETTWALIALHILQKPTNSPVFTFATFEQADNILTRSGNKVEDPEGVLLQHPRDPTSPAQTYHDDPISPRVSTLSPHQCAAGVRASLYYRENSKQTGLPRDGDICVEKRFHDIPPAIIRANTQAHLVIGKYIHDNNVRNSPWSFYKLVNIQTTPFDYAAVDTSNAATYYQANSVLETDYTLGNFKGRIASENAGNTLAGAPTSYTPAPPPQRENFKNIHLFPPTVPNNLAVNMGGCMGCHGTAQSALGADFSFILGASSTPFRTTLPETPDADSTALAAQRYHALFESQ
jgi:hypothetical protein